MAFVPTYTFDGGARGPLQAMAKDDLVVIPATIDFSATDTYVTNGMTVTLPDEIAELQLVQIVLTAPHDGTRLWVWTGDPAAPVLKAYDAFATEEGNGADISATSLPVLFICK